MEQWGQRALLTNGISAIKDYYHLCQTVMLKFTYIGYSFFNMTIDSQVNDLDYPQINIHEELLWHTTITQEMASFTEPMVCSFYTQLTYHFIYLCKQKNWQFFTFTCRLFLTMLCCIFNSSANEILVGLPDDTLERWSIIQNTYGQFQHDQAWHDFIRFF